MFHLNDEHASGIEGLRTFRTTVEIVHLEASDNAEGIFFLVTADLVNSGRDS